MGATVITNIAVFTHKPVSTPAASGGLFANEDPLVVVFSERYEKNCIPHKPAWGLDYVGSMGLFDEWVDKVAEHVEGGIVQYRACASTGGFRKAIKPHFADAQPLTPAVMARYRQRFTSISVEKRPLCEAFKSDEIEFETWLGTRVGMPIETAEQIENWLDDMVQLQNAQVAKGVPFYATTIWNEAFVPDTQKVF